MFTYRRTIMQAIAGAVAVTALCLAALTGATPAAHAAALAPDSNAAMVSAPHALAAPHSPAPAASQTWKLFTTFLWLDPSAIEDCYAAGAVGWAAGFWSQYYCTATWSGMQLWTLVDNAGG
jgi:hypothetical protein